MALVFVLLLGAAVVLLVKCLAGRKHRPGEPPLEQGWIPFIGKAVEFHRDSYQFLTSCRQKYGDIFTVYMAGKYITFVVDPFLFQIIDLFRRQINFKKISMEISAKIFGHLPLDDPKIQISKEEIHRHYRYLKSEELNVLLKSTTENLQNALRQEMMESAEWKIDYLFEFCSRIFIKTNYLSLYGRAVMNEQRRIIELKEKFLEFDKMLPYMLVIPVELVGNAKRIRKELLSYFTSDKLDQRLRKAKIIQARMDLLDLQSGHQNDNKAAHHFAFFWASVANTIPTVFWVLYHLMRNPEALAAVYDEIDQVLQGKGQQRSHDFNINLSKEELDSMVTLGSAVAETFRLSSSSLMIRTVEEDVTIKSQMNQKFKLRKGDWLALCPQFVHKDPEIYEEPEVYKYNRFVEDGMKKSNFYKGGNKLQNYMIPFGSGSSKCPGRYYALAEIKMFIFLLLSSFDLEIVKGEKQVRLSQERIGLGILTPDSDVQFRYKLRQ
ncbi:cytochrome P450 7B1-like isoform X2 [Narcine bancroftii]|uniref:cytochrome P450 7B1-like isoform X2 n=1 Tax=Narcine bancroftii TaxID=1343680 RepID=UPI003831A968